MRLAIAVLQRESEPSVPVATVSYSHPVSITFSVVYCLTDDPDRSFCPAFATAKCEREDEVVRPVRPSGRCLQRRKHFSASEFSDSGRSELRCSDGSQSSSRRCGRPRSELQAPLTIRCRARPHSKESRTAEPFSCTNPSVRARRATPAIVRGARAALRCWCVKCAQLFRIASPAACIVRAWIAAPSRQRAHGAASHEISGVLATAETTPPLQRADELADHLSTTRFRRTPSPPVITSTSPARAIWRSRNQGSARRAARRRSEGRTQVERPRRAESGLVERAMQRDVRGAGHAARLASLDRLSEHMAVDSPAASRLRAPRALAPCPHANEPGKPAHSRRRHRTAPHMARRCSCASHAWVTPGCPVAVRVSVIIRRPCRRREHVHQRRRSCPWCISPASD